MFIIRCILLLITKSILVNHANDRNTKISIEKDKLIIIITIASCILVQFLVLLFNWKMKSNFYIFADTKYSKIEKIMLGVYIQSKALF